MMRNFTLICAVAVGFLFPIQAFGGHSGGPKGWRGSPEWHSGPMWGGWHVGPGWMGRPRLAWRSKMGRVLVGWSLVGRLRRRPLLGVYPRWLGLELLLSARRK